MSITATEYAHVELDECGIPVISRTTTKVVEVVIERMADHSSPEELLQQHPYLSLGQILSALAYYEDHKEERDADIARRLQLVEELRAQAPEPPLLRRLRRQGLLKCRSSETAFFVRSVKEDML